MEKDYSYKRLFSFFKQFLAPYRGRFWIATLLSATSSAVWLYNAYALAKVVDFVVEYKAGQSLSPLYFVFTVWFVVMCTRYTTTFFARYIGMSMAEQAGKDAELYSIKHLSLLDISWHEKENTGNKLKRIDRGAQNIIDVTRLWLGGVVEVVVNIIGGFLIISQFDKNLAFFLAIYLIVYFFIARFVRIRAVGALKDVNIKDEVIMGLLFEIVANIRTVKILGMARKIIGLAKVETIDYTHKAKKRVFWFQIGGLLRGVWDGIGRILLLIFVTWGIIQGYYEVGFLVLFYGYFNMLTNSIGGVADITQELATYKANVGRLAEILDQPITIDNEEGKVAFPQNWESLIIRNLSFQYGDNSVLNGINLEIKKGEKVGIVGLSGAGKSTLFKLLLKEYENYGGEILVGGVSLHAIKKSNYVDHIAAVLQETEVFNMSLKQNITLVSSEKVDDGSLFARALDIAHVKDFLPKLKEGVETLIGEKGVRLSGGERQRLGIARAVFKGPEILFLDEATSHLDVESEQKIQDSLGKFFKDVTAVVIAHRLSTIKEMDRIIVIEHGKIIEEGTFDNLYASNGRFRDFWDKQKI